MPRSVDRATLPPCPFLAVGACLLGLAGCGGGSGDDDAARGTGTASIVGLYDAGHDVGDGVRDELYLAIGADASYRIYDYLGDGLDRGDNCHEMLRDDRLIARGGDRYTLEGDPEAGVATLRRSGDTLAMSFPDAFDDDLDGDVTETITERFPVVLNLSEQDLEPCRGTLDDPGDGEVRPGDSTVGTPVKPIGRFLPR